MSKTKNGTSLLRLWMREATTEQQERLARAANTTRAQLYQVAGGFRRFGPGKAGMIEREAEVMHRETKGLLPRLYRTDLAPECAACEYARQCLGPVAQRADFVVLEDDPESGDTGAPD